MENNSTKKQKNNKKKHKLFSYFLHDFVRVTSFVPVMLWLRPKKIKINAQTKTNVKGGALVVANHVCFTDPIYMLTLLWNRRPHFVIMKELMKSKLNTWLFTQFHCIPVDRERFKMKTFNDVCQTLDNDGVVVIYPEGGINRTEGEISSFKAGSVMMAYRAKKPIVPIYVVRPKKWYNRLVAVYGDPIDVYQMLGDKPNVKDFERVTEYLYQTEIGLRDFIEKGENNK